MLEQLSECARRVEDGAAEPETTLMDGDGGPVFGSNVSV